MRCALRVGTAILGRGFTGRLMGTVRDREGLTYGIGAGGGRGQHRRRRLVHFGELRAGAPRARRGIDAPGDSSTWWSDGVTDAELSAHKQGLIGSYRVSLSTAGGWPE